MAIEDTFDVVGHIRAELPNPAVHAFAITPHDANDLDYVTRGIYVGGAGNLKVTMLGGETVTFTGVAAGQIYPIRASRVFATLTTATSLVGVY
jgi:hypothetical protein